MSGAAFQAAFCAVCGRLTLPQHALTRVHYDQRTLEVCSRVCLKAFQTNPTPYLALAHKAERVRQWYADGGREAGPGGRRTGMQRID